jgi:hypothetical protein
LSRALLVPAAVGVTACLADFPSEGGSDAALDGAPSFDTSTGGGSEVGTPADAHDATESTHDASANDASSANDAFPDVFDAPSGPSCEAGLSACKGLCVDETSDPENCGRCGHRCQGGSCSGTPPVCQPVTLATGPVYIQGLAVGPTNVYWDNTMSGVPAPAGTINSISIDGGNPTVLASAQPDPIVLAADNTNLYWTDGSGVVKTMHVGGGGIATIASGQDNPYFVVVDANNVYWDTFNDGTVMSAPILGGTPVTLATGQLHPASLAVTATHVYWAGDTSIAIFRVPIGGGTVETLVAGGPPDAAYAGGGDIAVNATHLYWTQPGATPTTGTVMAIPLDGGSPTTLASDQDGPGAIALDATNVYWVTYNGGTVMALPLAGGTPITLASGQSGPGGLALDATTVYWANYAGGQVMKVAKP